MAQALARAWHGAGQTSPTPPVGAVIVHQGKVGAPWNHQCAGAPKAEVLALRQAGRRARGATLYVTLEPCCHLDKRTPPCVPFIIASGIKRVVAATRDPNPQVRGRGLAALRRAKLQVKVGVEAAQAERLIQAYSRLVTSGPTLGTFKVGAALDGKVATAKG